MDKTRKLIALSLRSIADALASLDKDVCERDLGIAADLLVQARAEAIRYYAKKITDENIQKKKRQKNG